MRTLHQRVTSALDILAKSLSPYVVNALQTIYHDRWEDAARESFRRDRSLKTNSRSELVWDAQSLLTVMWDQWNSIFRHRLGHAERSLVSELREYRNRWAHQHEFDFDDTYRVLDSVQRLLAAVSVDAAEEVAFEKRELLREEFAREQRATLERARIRQQIFRNVATYLICAVVVIFAFFTNFGITNVTIWLSLCTVMIFSYFTWEALTFRPPLFSPHECIRCSRIIYSEPCPYCSKYADRLDPAPSSDDDSSVVLDAAESEVPVAT